MRIDVGLSAETPVSAARAPDETANAGRQRHKKKMMVCRAGESGLLFIMLDLCFLEKPPRA
jgi:hypothetical protein